MKKFQIYNSLSNSLEDFVPIDSTNIRIYACGPTVYASPHIGNARPIVIYDVLYRILKQIYGKVTYVRNITDVDDKINAKAKALNISIKELTTKVLEEFHENIALLNILPVTHEPKATDHIQDMLSIIDMLIQNGYAYESNNHILFRIAKLESYGILSKRKPDEMIAGSRVEIASYKENALDFVLWKPAEPGSPSWESEFGNGRPGWHLECSAMSHKYLGERFDIHVGGHDLMFPHHENEIAQNFGAFGCMMANYWMHNGMLLVNGEKMSKSLDNIISLDAILTQLNGETIRFILLSTHYQKPLNWTEQLVIQAENSLNRLYNSLKLATEFIDYHMQDDCPVEKALCENLNTPLAIHHLHELADDIYKTTDPYEINKKCSILKKRGKLLGLLEKSHTEWFQKSSSLKISSDDIECLLKARQKAKSEKNFQLADQIRADLLQQNIQIEDSKEGTSWSYKNFAPKKT